ncbi:hypothetical protein KY362_02070 [Candidatus Woesearchaeota archaeon]|nr:hypothetical protein [Candidatus Woesearchaeota archaeon]
MQMIESPIYGSRHTLDEGETATEHRCPVDHSPLVYSEDTGGHSCKACEITYADTDPVSMALHAAFKLGRLEIELAGRKATLGQLEQEALKHPSARSAVIDHRKTVERQEERYTRLMGAAMKTGLLER